MGGVIVLLVVLVVVGLAVFSLWKMARNNVEMVPCFSFSLWDAASFGG